jgi:hypothetical protein
MKDDANLSNPVSLARIADQCEGVWHAFSDDELGRLWLEQISAEIHFDRRLISGDIARKLVDVASHGQPIPNRFCDLFRYPNPPIEMLEYTKQMAKRTRHHPDSPMQKISTVLYYASILIALLRCGRRITGLDDAALDYGFQWVLDQDWIDPATRRLFNEGRALLHAHA